MKPMDNEEEYLMIQNCEEPTEKIIREKKDAKFVPNISQIYGVDYGIFEEVIAFHDKKIE